MPNIVEYQAKFDMLSFGNRLNSLNIMDSYEF